MRRLLRIGTTLALIVALWTGLPVQPAAATFIGADGRIFYVTWSLDNLFWIHSLGADGSGHERLTRGRQVTVSPDGAWIAFLDVPAGEDDLELYVAWADGTHRRRVTRDAVDQSAPSFDPRAVPGSEPQRFRVVVVIADDLYRIDPGTGASERLTYVGDVLAGSGATDVSAYGEVLFLRDEEDAHDQAIWRLDPNGTDLRQLTDDDWDAMPEYTADARQIWFSRNRDDFEVVTMDASGNNEKTRTFTRVSERHVTPSPDGSAVAYTRDDDEIHVANKLYVEPVGGAPTLVPGALDGEHYVESLEWQVEEPPIHEIVSSPPALGNDPTPSFTFAADEVGTSFRCSLSGPGGAAPSVPCGVADGDGRHVYTVPAPLADGRYSLTLSSRDLSGAADPNPQTVRFEIDTDPPETGFSSGPLDGATVGTDRVTFGFGATENGARLECRLDSGSFAGCVSPRTVGPLPDGPHRFAVRALDAAGNADPTPVVRTFVVDTGQHTGTDPDPGPTPTPAPTCRGQEATIVADGGSRVVGTSGRDVIVGTPGRDVIVARGGADLVCAGGARDAVRGGGGRDRIYGQGGPDRLVGGSGPDRLFGQGGRDRLQGGAGNDRLVGGAKKDRCRGGRGRDRNRGC